MVSVYWMGILSVNISLVKGFKAYNFCCDGVNKYTEKGSKCDCSIRIVDCFIRVFLFKCCKLILIACVYLKSFWKPQKSLWIYSCYSSAQVTFPITCT